MFDGATAVSSTTFRLRYMARLSRVAPFSLLWFPPLWLCRPSSFEEWTLIKRSIIIVKGWPIDQRGGILCQFDWQGEPVELIVAKTRR
jgi:hypothetical protein